MNRGLIEKACQLSQNISTIQGHIANECAERRFGSAARKQIIMFLADKASDDGSGIW